MEKAIYYLKYKQVLTNTPLRYRKHQQRGATTTSVRPLLLRRTAAGGQSKKIPSQVGLVVAVVVVVAEFRGKSLWCPRILPRLRGPAAELGSGAVVVQLATMSPKKEGMRKGVGVEAAAALTVSLKEPPPL